MRCIHGDSIHGDKASNTIDRRHENKEGGISRANSMTGIANGVAFAPFVPAAVMSDERQATSDEPRDEQAGEIPLDWTGTCSMISASSENSRRIGAPWKGCAADHTSLSGGLVAEN